jgi:hypothetical protein
MTDDLTQRRGERGDVQCDHCGCWMAHQFTCDEYENPLCRDCANIFPKMTPQEAAHWRATKDPHLDILRLEE